MADTGATSSEPYRQRKKHREQQVMAAYALQRDAAIRGMVSYGLGGGLLVWGAHHIFPRFRSQTLAFKGFLASSCAIFGLVVGADTVLLTHEGNQRRDEDAIRALARKELGRRGILATEGEIQKWREERIAALRRQDEGREQ